jgi:hypothetical protein
MGEALYHLITGLTIVGFVSAVSYCEIKSQEARALKEKADADIQIACIKAGGEWVFGWTPAHCKLPMRDDGKEATPR